MKSVFKITGLIFLSLIAILFLALLFLPYIVDLNKYREAAAKELGRTLNRKVSVGEIRLTTLTGVGVGLKDIKVDEELLEVDNLRLRLSLLPLLKGRIEFSRIIIDRPSLLLKRDKDGNWNISQAAEGDKLKASKPSVPEKKYAMPSKILTALLVSDMEIKNGKVRLQDISSKKPVSLLSIKGLDIRARDISLNNAIKIKGTALLDMDNSKPSKMELSGTVGPVGGTIDVKGMPVNTALKIKDIDLTSYNSFLGLTKDNKLSGHGFGDITIKGRMDDLGISGKINLDNLEYSYILGPADGNKKTGRIKLTEIKIPLDMKGRIINLNELNFRLYEGASKIAIHIDTNKKEPYIKLKPDLASVQLEPLLKDLAISKINISGPLSLNASIRAYGMDKDTMLAKADGDGFFIIKKGTITDLELIDVIVNLATLAASKTKKAGKVTEFDELSGHFRIEKGYLKTDDLKLIGSNLSIAGRGYYGLLKSDLNLDVDAKVDDNHVELKITGTTDKPKYVLKTKRIQQNIMKGVVKGLEKGKVEEKDVREILKNILK
jgi:uncharacterized protein involved in outer membrane biogenesis